MRPPNDPDIEMVCTGARVHWGKNLASSTPVAQTPREVRELVRSSEDDLVEFGHKFDPEVKLYVNRNEIVAVIPYWSPV